MKVYIKDAETNLLVVEVPISFGLLGERTKEDDMINEAWRSAVEDKTVDPENRGKYKFSIVN